MQTPYRCTTALALNVGALFLSLWPSTPGEGWWDGDKDESNIVITQDVSSLYQGLLHYLLLLLGSNPGPHTLWADALCHGKPSPGLHCTAYPLHFIPMYQKPGEFVNPIPDLAYRTPDVGPTQYELCVNPYIPLNPPRAESTALSPLETRSPSLPAVVHLHIEDITLSCSSAGGSIWAMVGNTQLARPLLERMWTLKPKLQGTPFPLQSSHFQRQPGAP